ncbi:MAG: glycine--tRNA ligase subunit beta [Gammaproteobacteria bacterium]
MSPTQDLLFELGTEELPPLALQRLSQALSRGFLEGLERANLTHGPVQPFAAPRRLGLLIRDCQTRQADREIERRGPAVAAAFDAEGKPTKAAEGFARSCGTEVAGLARVETDKGAWLAYRVREVGRPTAELLPGIADEALAGLPIPKRMRWGDSDAQFVRPVHWLLFLLGDEVVPCTLLDASADRLTYGHRFHHPQAITVFNPGDYADLLGNLGHVVPAFDERRQRIRQQVVRMAETLGGEPDLDDDLLDEVTALNEWPVPIAASFEERFLEVPHEALVLTMKQNQKYFPLFDADGRLMNHFVTIANIDSPKPELIRAGNERVVRPRLADAMFFWEQDGKGQLEDHVDGLRQVVFQQQLGTLYDKSERVAKLAAYIAIDIGGDPRLARRAGLLSRCDLLTQMVYEFPEMQGVMGRYQARRDGEPDEVCQAMEEFYLPRFSGDELPRSRTGIAVSLAEKLDTLVGIFGIGQRPTGDKDPFALRRAALGALRILREHSLPLELPTLLEKAADQLADRVTESGVAEAVYAFMLERLRGLYGELGVEHDLFQAVLEVQPPVVADFDRRISAVAAFRDLPEAAALAAANKRIRNILRKADEAIPSGVDTRRFTDPEERHLHGRVIAMATEVTPMLENGDYEGALKALAGLREPVDAFFDRVMVMAEDPEVRRNRLALLQELSGLFLGVADISALHS